MRPPPNAIARVPPASVPLSFFAAAAVGLVGLGIAAALAADEIVASPLFPATLGTVHVAMLAFLTVGVLAALHQFAPVVGRGPLRSVAVARVSGVGIVLTAWLLPIGFARGPEDLVPTAGLLGAASIALIAWNVSGPLGPGARGLPVWGLRASLTFLVVTVAFGVVYAFDRQTGWFPLLSHRVLAHAHLGLLGWLGLTYVSVAEKLWPMFLLSHRPSDRSGRVAVAALATGVAVLTPGLLFAWPPIAWAGAAIAAAGLGAHLVSLAAHVRHRRRPLELLHAFILTSAGFLVVAAVLALLTATLDVNTATRTRLASAEVMALTAWLGLALVGHVHKIVPFIGYQRLRAAGVQHGPTGGPLLFADLVGARTARISFVTGSTGAALMLAGIVADSAATLAAGAVLWSVTGLVTAANLVARPRQVRRHAARAGTVRMPGGAVAADTGGAPA